MGFKTKQKNLTFSDIAKNNIDIWFRQVAFNIQRGLKIFNRMDATA